MSELKNIDLILHDNTIIIKLKNEENKAVFMQYYFSFRKKSQFAFIEVDTLKEYWGRNHCNEYSKYANASESELRHDYKFSLAEEGFSRGYEDPVPVAEIGLLNYTTPQCIGFQNGMTRTIWLMANGYKIIPFEVSNITTDFLLEKGVYSFK